MWLLSVALASPFFVTDHADVLHPSASCNGDPCSLRDAMVRANASPGLDWIDLQVPNSDVASPIAVTDEVIVISPSWPGHPVTATGPHRIFEVTAPMTLTDVHLVGGGLVPGDGGCIHTTSSLVMSRVWLEGCEASDRGGSVFVDGGSVSMGPGRVSDGWAVDGGAFGLEGGSLHLDGVGLWSNEAEHRGGAVFATSGATVDLSASDAWSNHAESGGAVHVDVAAELTVEGTTLRENLAFTGGAVFARQVDEVRMIDSRFNDNIADDTGGAGHIEGVSGLDIEGSVFARNLAPVGAALRLLGTHTTALNNTFSHHHSIGFTPYGVALADAAISHDATDPVGSFAGRHLTFFATGYSEQQIEVIRNQHGTDIEPHGPPGEPEGPGGEGGGLCPTLAISGIERADGSFPVQVSATLGVLECVGSRVRKADAVENSIFTWSLSPDFVADANILLLHETFPLAGNGGPTETHGLASNHRGIGATACFAPDDQRNVPRATGGTCDVGAFERESTDDDGDPWVDPELDPNPYDDWVIVPPWWW